MRILRGSQVFIRAGLIAWVLLLVGCMGVGVPLDTRIACGQCEEVDRFVRLQVAMADAGSVSAQRCTHPFVLSAEDWTAILTELHVQRQADGLLWSMPQGPVLLAFTKEEMGYLSVTLNKAFAHAQPNEWVVFGLSRSTPQGLTELTTGGAYVQGPSLHIVFANYRKVVTMPGPRHLLWEHPLRPDAGPAYILVAGPHQAIVRDPNAVSSLLSPAPAELSIAYQALLLREPVVVSASQETSTVNPSTAHSSRNVLPPLSTEERLRVLKRFQAQGLITDEEYRTKKQQILERF